MPDYTLFEEYPVQVHHKSGKEFPLLVIDGKEIELPEAVISHLYCLYRFKLMEDDVQDYINDIKEGRTSSKYTPDEIEENIGDIVEEYEEIMSYNWYEDLKDAIDCVCFKKRDE